MKRIKFIIGAMSIIALIAVIASCGQNPFKEVKAKQGKYEGTHTNGTKYEFFFTDSGAYKVIIGIKQTDQTYSYSTYYGKGEDKDDGYRATVKTIKVRYQSGLITTLEESEGKLYYVRNSDNKKVELSHKSDLKSFTPNFKDKSEYKYTGKGNINYENDERPWGVKDNRKLDVNYTIKFYHDKKKVAINWVEGSDKKYFFGKYKYINSYRVNMDVKECKTAYAGDGSTEGDYIDGATEIKRYAVFDPEDTTKLIFEASELK